MTERENYQPTGESLGSKLAAELAELANQNQPEAKEVQASDRPEYHFVFCDHDPAKAAEVGKAVAHTGPDVVAIEFVAPHLSSEEKTSRWHSGYKLRSRDTY